MQVSMKMSGITGLKRMVRKMDKKQRRRATTRGIADSAKLVNRELKKAAPLEWSGPNLPGADPDEPPIYRVGDKRLRKSIGRRRRWYQATGTAVEVIGPRNMQKFSVLRRDPASSVGIEYIGLGRSVGQSGLKFVPMTRVAHLIEREKPFVRPTATRLMPRLQKKIRKDLGNSIREVWREAKRGKQ